MSREQVLPQIAAPRSPGRWRRLVPVLIGLAVLAVGGGTYWWLDKPTLEPLPIVATQRMEPQIRVLVERATAGVTRDERSAAAWAELGAVCFANHITSEAAVCFRNAERLDARDYRWPYILGYSLIYVDVDESLSAYRRAAQRCGERPHVQLQLADVLLERGENEEASAEIEKVLSYAPTNPRAQFAKARILVAQGNYQEAKPWAERSAAAAANMRAPRMLVAKICHMTNDSAGEAQALAALQQIPEQFDPWEDPDISAMSHLCQDSATRLKRARSLAKKGETETLKGILYEMAAKGDGGAAAADLAYILYSEGKFRQTENFLRHHLPAFPNNERLRFLLGAACFEQEKPADAEVEFRRAVELKPDYFEAWYDLGLTLLKLGKQGDARDAFATTVRLNPGHALARINLAELLLAEGKREQAKEQLEVAIKLDPKIPLARELLAKANAELK